MLSVVMLTVTVLSTIMLNVVKVNVIVLCVVTVLSVILFYVAVLSIIVLLECHCTECRYAARCYAIGRSAHYWACFFVTFTEVKLQLLM